MKKRILVTGSEGLIGTALSDALAQQGYDVVSLDLQALGPRNQGDVRKAEDLHRSVRGCIGIVHLAAVSRVIDGEKNPDRCWETNVGGTRNVIAAALSSPIRPWIIQASSREVYGQPASLPVCEDIPLAPVNIYGRSKIEGERLISEARSAGLRTAILRFSNVYGWTRDHSDRVVPAFARAAAFGLPLRVDGADHTFDFTHIDDTITGIMALIALLQAGEAPPPPIHLLTGQPTTLGQLARLAVELAGTNAAINDGPPRTFDVSHFYGSPRRAEQVLGWRPRTTIRDGLARLIDSFRADELATMACQAV